MEPQTASSPTISLLTPELNGEITTFGRAVFSEIGNQQPSTFNKNYWTGRMMEWSMKRPDFKINLFRLVDVLPALRSNRAVAEHLAEYLSEAGAEINPLLGWGLRVKPGTVRGTIAALAVRKSVHQMAAQFIAGETPGRALGKLRGLRRRRLSFTVDLLGEFSVSEKEAIQYLNRYLDALDVLGTEVPRWTESAPIVEGNPGELSPVSVSVKLSALYSQCNVLNFDRSVAVLSDRLAAIVRKAKEKRALLYVDAEDTGNNPIIYATFKRVFSSAEFRDFPYPGAVVQAYQRESRVIVEDLLRFAREHGAPIAVRLVKGAYYDHETVLCNQNGWPSPLWSRKESSDANYEALSRLLLDNHEVCFPAFGSHNVRSLCHACCYAESRGISKKQYELQMLYGMAEPIARAFAQHSFLTRLYVPLGEMLPGMGYLVRRLLENTSNESFLRHTFFDSAEIDELLREPRLLE